MREMEVVIEALEKKFPKRNSMLNRPSVIVGYLPIRHGFDCESIEVILLWIQERGDWVMLEHGSYRESMWGDSEYYRGPFRIDDVCAKKILQAHGVTDQTIPLDQVGIISPEHLNTI